MVSPGNPPHAKATAHRNNLQHLHPRNRRDAEREGLGPPNSTVRVTFSPRRLLLSRRLTRIGLINVAQHVGCRSRGRWEETSAAAAVRRANPFHLLHVHSHAPISSSLA